MSDAYGSYGNPYGVPPPYPHQLPQGPPELSQLPPPDPRQRRPADLEPPVAPDAPDQPRPGVVVAGAVIAFVLTGLSIVVLLIGVAGVIGAHADHDPDDHISRAGMVAGLVMCGLGLAVCVAGIVITGRALARRQWARVATVVLAFLSAAAVVAIGIAMMVGGGALAAVVGGLVVLVLGLVAALSGVLLLMPSARRWYAGRPRVR